jgi:hypothetical protein
MAFLGQTLAKQRGQPLLVFYYQNLHASLIFLLRFPENLLKCG